MPQPSQSEKELTLLLKLLGMTGSDNDAEALGFIRKANEHLARMGWTWDTLLRGKVTVLADPFAAAPQVAPLRPDYQRPSTSWAPPQPAAPQPSYATYSPPPYTPKPRRRRYAAPKTTLADLGLD